MPSVVYSTGYRSFNTVTQTAYEDIPGFNWYAAWTDLDNIKEGINTFATANFVGNINISQTILGTLPANTLIPADAYSVKLGLSLGYDLSTTREFQVNGYVEGGTVGAWTEAPMATGINKQYNLTPQNAAYWGSDSATLRDIMNGQKVFKLRVRNYTYSTTTAAVKLEWLYLIAEYTVDEVSSGGIWLGSSM